MQLVQGTSVTLTNETAFSNIVIDNKFLTHSQVNSPSDKFPLWINKQKQIHIASHSQESLFSSKEHDYKVINHTIDT